MHMDEPYGDGTFALTVNLTDAIPNDDNLVRLSGSLPPRDDTHREYLLKLFSDIMAKG
jgi:hypothetical protein